MEYRIIGVSKQKNCDCCKKVNLRLTIVVSEVAANGKEVRKMRYGTTCAARATEYRIWNGAQFGWFTPSTIDKLARSSQYNYEQYTGEKVA